MARRARRLPRPSRPPGGRLMGGSGTGAWGAGAPDPASADPRVGLCAACRHVRRAGNRRGSVFYRCARAEYDPRFRKYPPLPVLRCIGYEHDGDASDGVPDDGDRGEGVAGPDTGV